MASPTREEIQRRIAQDDGDPGEQVVVALGASASSSVSAYHAHARCQTIRWETETERMSRERAQELGKGPCKVCVLENVENPGPTLSQKLESMDPEDAGLTPFPPRADGGDSS